MSGRALAVALLLGVLAAAAAWAAVLLLSPWALLAWPAMWLVLLAMWLAERHHHDPYDPDPLDALDLTDPGSTT